jgi:hypothetical protein
MRTMWKIVLLLTLAAGVVGSVLSGIVAGDYREKASDVGERGGAPGRSLDGGQPDEAGRGDDSSPEASTTRPLVRGTDLKPSLLAESARYFAAVKTLEGLLMYTDGVDTPTVTISAVGVGMPRDSRLVANPMVRVSVKLPGKRAVRRSGWSLPEALSAALLDAYGVDRELK